jgi:hypothetical protein
MQLDRSRRIEVIVADPFGSWVQGAHEGQQDAIALREAQDRSAQNAYNLQHAATFDPQQYRMLHNAADTSSLELGQNQKIYGADIPFNNAQVGLEHARLGNAAEQTNLGDPAAYYKYATQYGGGQYTPAGGIRYPVTGADGQTHWVATPEGSVVSPQQLNPYYRSMYNQGRLEQGQEGRDIQMRRLEDQEGGMGGMFDYGNHSLGIPRQNPPAARVTAPQTNAPINLNAPQASVPGMDPYGLARKAGTNRDPRIA